MLFMLLEAVAYFWLADPMYYGDSLLILFGILNIVFIFIMFVSLNLIGTGPVKIPYFWWLMVIIGVLLIVFSYLISDYWGYAFGLFFLGNMWGVTPFPYLTGSLVLLAVIVELIAKKKDFGASKIVGLIGIGLTIFDCIVIFMNYTDAIFIVHGVFGLILAIILLIIMLDLVDIKIPFNWWVFLTIAFVIFAWVSPLVLGAYPASAWGGLFLMIAWILVLFAM
jgi:hypothetical protein